MIRKPTTPASAAKAEKTPKAKKPKLSKAERIEARRARRSRLWARFRRKPKPPSSILPPFRDRKPSRRRDIILLTCFGLFFFIYGYAYALFTPYLIPALSVPLLVVLGLVIWQLPEMDRAPTGAVSWLFFAFTVGMVTWPTYLAIAFPGLPWITILRLIGFPMTALFLVSLSVSKAFRDEIAKVLGTSKTTSRLMMIFILAQIISLPLSPHMAESIQKMLNNVVNWTAIFYISCYVGLKPGAIRRWANILLLASIPICLIAIRENQIGEVLWANHLPSFFAVDESVARSLSGASRDGAEHRVQSVFTTPLGLGEYLALTMPFMLHFALKPGNLWLRLAALFWAMVMFYVVLLSDARLGLIGCLMTMVLYALAWGALQWQRRKDSIFGPAVVLSYPAIALAAFAATLAIGRLREKIWGSGQYDASNQGRKDMYDQGIPMILSHPLGHGAGMAASTLGITNPGGVLTIDTYYIAIGLDYGILGFIGYYGMIAVAIWRTARQAVEVKEFDGDFSYFMPIAIALANFFYIKAVFSNEENHPLIFMMIGMSLALAYRLANEHKPAVNASAGLLNPLRPLLGRRKVGVAAPQGATAFSSRRTPPSAS